jgi:hypothetical protein
MENIVKAGAGTIKAHLEHLREHGQHDYLHEAIQFLRDKRIAVPLADQPAPEQAPAACGCPGSRMMDFTDEPTGTAEPHTVSTKSALRQWPVQLQLLSPYAPYFKEADLVIAADCVPFSYPNFHDRFLKGRTLIILCPKLDKVIEEYIDKLAEIFRANDIKSVTVVHMEVPCCFGLNRIIEEALKKSGKSIPTEDYTVSIKGEVI